MRVVVNYGRWSREEMLRAAQQAIAQRPKAWHSLSAALDADAVTLIHAEPTKEGGHQ